jgi:hypothetical protein
MNKLILTHIITEFLQLIFITVPQNNVAPDIFWNTNIKLLAQLLQYL